MKENGDLQRERNKKSAVCGVLDNGVTLYVYDGYAEGSDGKIYKPVIKDIDDDEIEVVGWSLDSPGGKHKI